MSTKLIIWNFVRRPSVRPSTVSQFSQNLVHRIFSNFSCCLPWAIRPGLFLKYWSKKYIFQIFTILFFIFVNMGPMEAKTSKRYLFLKSLLNLFKLFRNFLLCGPDKSIFGGIFEILRNFQLFFSFLLTWVPMAAKTSRPCSSLKSLFYFSQLLWNILVSGPHESSVLNFSNFELTIFNDSLSKVSNSPYGT